MEKPTSVVFGKSRPSKPPVLLAHWDIVRSLNLSAPKACAYMSRRYLPEILSSPLLLKDDDHDHQPCLYQQQPEDLGDQQQLHGGGPDDDADELSAHMAVQG